MGSNNELTAYSTLCLILCLPQTVFCFPRLSGWLHFSPSLMLLSDCPFPRPPNQHRASCHTLFAGGSPLPPCRALTAKATALAWAPRLPDAKWATSVEQALALGFQTVFPRHDGCSERDRIAELRPRILSLLHHSSLRPSYPGQCVWLGTHESHLL